MKENKLIFPFIFLTISCFLYFLAFHDLRDKFNELKLENKILKTKLEIYEKR